MEEVSNDKIPYLHALFKILSKDIYYYQLGNTSYFCYKVRKLLLNVQLILFLIYNNEATQLYSLLNDATLVSMIITTRLRPNVKLHKKTIK